MTPTNQDWVPRNKTHGLSYGKFYATYHRIKQRCENQKYPKYPIYGGRGIQCGWLSFTDFKRDMYEQHLEHIAKHGKKNTTIDRIDSERGYSKENCRWATYSVQNDNRRTVLLVEIKGVQKSVSGWCREFGLNRNCAYARIYLGWSPIRAVTTPSKKYG